MTKRDKQSVTDSNGSTLFGPQVRENTRDEFTLLINRGPNRVYLTGDQTDAVADTGINLDPGESANTKDDLPGAFREGNFKAVCASGESAELYWGRA